MNFAKKTRLMRAISFFVAIILVSVSFAVYPTSVSADDAVTVYVSPNGSDYGSGTASSPYKTLAAAYKTLSGYGGGTVVIMGDVESDNSKAWNDAKKAWGWASQTKPITITGKDPATGEIYEDAKLRYNAIGLLGETKIEYLKMVPARSSCFVNTCGYKFTIGNGIVSEGYTFVVHDGIGESKYGVVSSTNTIVENGSAEIIFVGGGYATSPSQGVTGDCSLTLNGGSISRITIGFDAYSTSHTTARIDGNVIITVNEGIVGGVNTARINDNTVGGFVALVFNNATISSYELPEAQNGVYVIRSGNHGMVEATDNPGVFKVTSNKGYYAQLDGEEISDGEITVEPGEHVIKYLREGQATAELLETSYVDGYPDGTFHPDEPISRAEAVSLIISATTNPDTIRNKYTTEFTDLLKSDWYYDAIAYLEYMDILPSEWNESSLLYAEKSITRGEFVYIVDNILPKYPVSIKLFDFSDVSSDSPYYNAIMSAARSGCVNGFEDGSFGPEKTLTRAEAVTIINRYIDRTPASDAVSDFSDTSGHWAETQIAAASSDLASGNWTFSSLGEQYVIPAPGSGAENYVKSLYAQSSYLSGEAIREGVDVISEQMKKDILYTPNTLDIYSDRITGTIYYVSEKNGNDANDGKSESRPIKTISKLKTITLRSGDAVLFERGGIYRGQITVSGGVVYGSYGSGDKPLIMQSKKNYGGDPSLWVETEYPNVYKCTEKLQNVGIIGFDHDLFDYSEDSYYELYGKIMNLDTFNFTGPADLNEDLQFYSDITAGLMTVGDLYLYSTEGNPGERFDSIEIGERINIFVAGNPNGCTIDNLAMKFTGAHAVGFGTCEDVTVTNCVFSWLGGSVLQKNGNSAAVNYGNAVEIYGGCNGYHVENNWMYQIYDTGVTHQFSDGTACTQEGVRYYGNLIEYCHWGIEFYNAPGDGSTPPEDKYTRDVISAYNVLRMGGYGWGSIVRYRQKSARMYCCASLSLNEDEHAFYNIFDRCAGYLLNLPANSTEEDDSNIYIQTIGCTLGLLKGVLKTCTYDMHNDIRNYFGDYNAVTVAIDE